MNAQTTTTVTATTNAAVADDTVFVNIGDAINLGGCGLLFLTGDTSRLPEKIRNELRDSEIEQLTAKRNEAEQATFGGPTFSQEESKKLTRLMSERELAKKSTTH